MIKKPYKDVDGYWKCVASDTYTNLVNPQYEPFYIEGENFEFEERMWKVIKPIKSSQVAQGVYELFIC